jgi:hemerythrin-like domain-containing protein
MKLVKSRQPDEVDESSLQSFPASDAPAWPSAASTTKSPAAGDNPVEILLKEHIAIHKVLEALVLASKKLQGSSFVDIDRLKRLYDFMQNFVSGYHEKREDDILLPLLEANQADRSITIFRHTHREAEKKIRIFAICIEKYARNEVTAKQELAESMTKLAKFYEDHLCDEEKRLFPLATKLLNAGAERQLAAALEAQEEKYEAFYQMADRLAKI